jgi:hypothetical protein
MRWEFPLTGTTKYGEKLPKYVVITGDNLPQVATSPKYWYLLKEQENGTWMVVGSFLENQEELAGKICQWLNS